MLQNTYSNNLLINEVNLEEINPFGSPNKYLRDSLLNFVEAEAFTIFAQNFTFMSDKQVRVRFAPSPTGPLHIGGVRTALFNYLFAKKHEGKFILRIEDTDQTRYVEGAEKYIVESLEWCGLQIDEGPGINEQYGPYRQSERKDLYKQYALQLIESGNAYYAFDTAEELTALRLEAEANKEPFVYNCKSRTTLQNSLNLSAEEVQQKIDAGDAYVIRFKMEADTQIDMYDEIRKDISYSTNDLDDKVLFKSDGMPTYHLANVVDDYLMKISHVIRGEEWLPSMPLHVMLYKALGWEADMPKFAHLPLILKPKGKGKLSKRDGDQMGFPVFPLEWKSPDGEISRGYREDGYFPDAFANMLALLGWNPGTEQEIFSMDELAQAFSLERVGRSGSKFDPDKTKWFNHQYLLAKSDAEVAQEFAPLLAEKGIEADAETIERICGMVKERANFVTELWDHSFYFFQAPVEYDAKVKKKRWKGQVPSLVNEIRSILDGITPFSSENCETTVKEFLTSKEVGLGGPMNGLRLSIVGSGVGAHLFDIMEIIGKEETLNRLAKAIEVLGIPDAE